MNEKISVVMTSYNYAQYIGEAIQSVINQTYTNWELIIVDDGSTDNSVEVIRTFLKDPRIKLYVNEKNLGLAANLKKAVTLATGEWIAFLESDDIFYPNSIEEKVKAISTGADIIFTDYETIPVSDCAGIYRANRKKYIDLGEAKFIESFDEFIYRLNIIPTLSVAMVKKDILIHCDFNSPIRTFVDWFLWSQLANCQVYYINESLTHWRRHVESYCIKYKQNLNEILKFKSILYMRYAKGKNVIKKIVIFLEFITYFVLKILHIRT